MPERALGWLCLQQVPGLGPVRLAQLRHAFGTPDRVLAASAAAWADMRLRMPVQQVQRLARAARPQAVAWLERVQAIGGWVMTVHDDDYPTRLRQHPTAPVVLFGLGDRAALSPAESVAIIGTRRPTRPGLLQAERIGRDVAAAGVTVVSGLARGIDGAAHRGALQAGKTVAVLGSGLDVIYPPEHRRLARDIAASGAVITEYPPGTQPEPFRFPERNRLISGLSDLLYLVEAGLRSGTVKTVEQALQEKTVLVWPGHPASPQSAFPRRLMVDGAPPCTSSAVLLDVLRNRDKANAVGKGPDRNEAAGTGADGVPAELRLPPGPAGTVLSALIEAGEATPAQLAAAAGLPLPAVLSILMLLELKGLVLQLPGSRYAALQLPDVSLAGSASL